MSYFDDAKNNREELSHHGVKGQHWGVRRFQRTDGTLTAAGKNRLKTKIVEAGKKVLINDKAREALNKKHPGQKVSVSDALKSEMNKRKTRTEEFKKNLDEVNSKSSTKEHAIYNSATRARAAKIMTKNKDIKVDDAIKQAEKEARRNTALVASLIVSYGIVKLSSMGNNNPRAIKSNSNSTLDSVAKSLDFTPPKPHTGPLYTGSTKRSSSNIDDVFGYKKK